MLLTPSSATRAIAIFAKQRGVLRTGEALQLGIHPRTLYQLRDGGEIAQVGRGTYRLANRKALSNPDWVVIAAKAPNAVFCLVSALAYHRLSTQVPHAIDIAIPNHTRYHKLMVCPSVHSGIRLLRSRLACKGSTLTVSPFAYSIPRKRSLIVSSTATRLASTSQLRLCAVIEIETDARR